MRPLFSEDTDNIYPISEDTLLLFEVACEEIQSSDRVFEVGVGRGYIATQLLGKVAWFVATDINPYAVRMARDYGIEVIQTDLTAGICGIFDLILFNPPYLPTQPEERIEDWLEFALDGGPTGREVIGRFANEVGRVLAPHGRILLLISSLTGQKEVEGVFERQGLVGRIKKYLVLESETLFVYRFTRKANSEQ